MAPTVIVTARYERADGTVLTRQVTVVKSVYGRQPMAKFKSDAKRRAIEAVNAVLGMPAGVKVEDA